MLYHTVTKVAFFFIKCHKCPQNCCYAVDGTGRVGPRLGVAAGLKMVICMQIAMIPICYMHVLILGVVGYLA